MLRIQPHREVTRQGESTEQVSCANDVPIWPCRGKFSHLFISIGGSVCTANGDHPPLMMAIMRALQMFVKREFESHGWARLGIADCVCGLRGGASLHRAL